MSRPDRIIRIVGGIDDTTFRAFTKKLAKLERDSDLDVTVELMSSGGDTYSALAIAGRIRSSPLKIKVVGYGMIASAAVIILAYGDVRQLTKEAWVMVHEDSDELAGEVKELEKQAKHARELETQWGDLLAATTKASADVWNKLHAETTWFRSDLALKLGLIDEVLP